VVAQARNGREAVELFDQLEPAVAFLDVHMPGMNGIEAGALHRPARRAGVRHGVRPLRGGGVRARRDRLPGEAGGVRAAAETVDRLQRRLAEPAAQPGLEATLDQLAAQLRERSAPPARLQWIKASVGNTVRLIPVDEVIYLKSDNKYTLVVWEGGEALIRKTIRELADALDPQRFAQIHARRS
jgi:DNA-binding LytR/AlgR family response regulator